MPVSQEVLAAHIDYTAWASRKLVESAAQLSLEQLNHDFGTADRSVLGTLVHIFAADRLWLARVSGGPHPGFVAGRDRSLAILQTEWPELHDRWRQWVRGVTDTNRAITYTDMKGNQWTQPLWQLMLHIVNHGTHHRGQVSGFLRALGQTPPPLDLVYYYREPGAVTTSLPTPSR
jgi:uncharacterized damage-inducible protein DinB